MTMNAPVGPPICTLLPPKNEMMNPATIAVMMPFSRKGYDAYDDACHQVGHKVCFRVIPKCIEELRLQLKRFHAY